MRLIRFLAFGVLGASAALLLTMAASTAIDRPATSEHDELITAAPRHELWRLLTDFEGYADWNPFVTRASGEARPGGRIRLTLQPDGADAYEVECEVITVHEPRKLYWRCRDHDVPGLLDREHTFRLIPAGPGRIRLVYHGRWEGVLVPFADLDDRKQGYERMVVALAARAARAVEDGK